MIETKRLHLGQWSDQNIKDFVQMNSCPLVMRYFSRVYTEEESISFIRNNQKLIEIKGYGLFSVIHKESQEFVGFIGLFPRIFDVPFSPCTEIAWRLRSEYWNQGLATEGALSCLDFAFKQLRLKEIVSFTSVHNHSSIKVMKKIGMTSNKEENFFHPAIEKEHKLSLHVLYRISP